jgi:hypothetical protein
MDSPFLEKRRKRIPRRAAGYTREIETEIDEISLKRYFIEMESPPQITTVTTMAI